ncbi:GNAT family N-acetyltransferase [Nocardia stercoris]|uniref:N-acetyltransferase n=1 Tax=Nocardia stercoris TaxID=2483361 RepID=A0A3M2KVR7_9NOCA|nr:GNAT family protein [Nocardia stercoris]RMI29291.1 N-acetyltransferase [Nocardia stercoris]
MTFRYPDDVPVLTDGVVVLRAHREQDLDAMVEHCRDPEMVRYTTVPRPYSRTHAEEFLALAARNWTESAPNSERVWAITTTDPERNGRFCGGIDFRPTGTGTATIGFGLHPAARGHGLMARAVDLVLDYAFTHGVEVVHWSAIVGNWASRKTVSRLGFRYEGIIGDFVLQRGRPQDVWTASLHRDDPRRSSEPWPVE